MPRGAAAAAAARVSYGVGDKVNCVWMDGTSHEAEILEERVRTAKSGPKSSDDEGTKETEYYVHYVDCKS